MFIFLRGLPGSGKTTVSDKLGEKMGCEVIHVDNFKKEFAEKNPKAFFIEEVVPYSYKKTLEVLEGHRDKNLIIEEIFRNNDFVARIQDFCAQNAIATRWFIIERDFNKIIEANEIRKRSVKNTPETLELMKQQIKSTVINGELAIKNEDLDACVQAISEQIGTL